jgi:hypothetical protein
MTSGTYAFQPSVADLVLNAYGRIGLKRAELTQQHMADAATEANFVQVEMASRQPNLWMSELYTVALVSGTATYTLPARMISPMAVYLTITPSGGTAADRILMPISTFEYAALPVKTQTGTPSQYWYNRQVAPQITLWPVPDDAATYTLNLQILSQPQDASIPNGVTPQLPFRWLDAFTAALAARLADIYASATIQAKGPSGVTDLWAKAERAWQIAANEDHENVPTYIIPGISSYYGSNR